MWCWFKLMKKFGQIDQPGKLPVSLYKHYKSDVGNIHTINTVDKHTLFWPYAWISRYATMKKRRGKGSCILVFSFVFTFSLAMVDSDRKFCCHFVDFLFMHTKKEENWWQHSMPRCSWSTNCTESFAYSCRLTPAYNILINFSSLASEIIYTDVGRLIQK